jgi:type IV pilus assembly protein PilY1
MRNKRFATKATAWALICALVNPALTPWAYARDTDIFLGVTSVVATAEPNILIVMDTSDTMNIAEPWREYDLRDADGNPRYDSHIEYLWNDPTYINTISTQAPADNLFSNAGSSPDNYFYNYSGSCPNASNPDCPKDSGFFAGATDADRTALRTAALAYAAATEPGDPGARSTYRNYSDAAWIYWLPTGTAETDSRLWSFAFNRFVGGIRVSSFSSSNGSTNPVVRGGFNYGNIRDFTQGSSLRTSSGAFNRCTASGSELLPSTVYAPTEFARNSGKWVNQEWVRWERWLNLENSRAAAYPGSHNTVAYTSGTYRIGYVGTGYDPSVTPFPGPNDPRVNQPASTPHGVEAPPVPNITSARDNIGTNGSQGQPIRVQDDSGTSGFADDPTDSQAGWTTLKADLGGYTYQSTVNSMSQTTLQALRGVYGYPLLASAGASATELERFSAWKGSRDDAAAAFGMVTGTPAYYDIRPTSSGEDIIFNNAGVTGFTCTRTCGNLAVGASGPTSDGVDGGNTARRYFRPNGSGQYCDPNGTLSGDCQSITGNPLHPTDPPLCSPANTTNFVDRNHTGCTWTGRSSKFVEGVGTVYYGGTCSGQCRGAGFILGGANCASGTDSTNYCNQATAGNSGTNWIGSYTIDGTSYNNVTKNVIGTCSDIGDTSQSCVTRKGFQCLYGPGTVASFCPNRTSSTTTGGTQTRYPAYNRQGAETNLVHDCKADELANNGGTNVYMTSQKRNFDQSYNTSINTAGTTAAYTTNSAHANTSPAIDLYSVNYLNWKFGAKGPSGAPIGRKTRLQIAKDALADLIAATDGVRFGVMTFNALPQDTSLRSSQGSQGGKIIFPIKRMGNNASDPDYVNRAALTNAINNQVAKAASPLTETMYEAYLYFNGRAPRYGTATAMSTNFGAAALAAVGGGNVTDGADASAISGSSYVSPMLNNPTTATPASCQKNFVIMITDGGPEHDVDASDFVPGLSYTSLSGVVSADTRVDSSQTATSTGHFETGGVPYGQPSRFNELRTDSGYVWLDEVAYFMAHADMSPGARHDATESTTDSLLGTQAVTTYTIGFAGANSPVVQNAGERSAGVGGYYIAEDSAGLAEALTAVLITIRDYSPTVAAPTVPLSALNRAQNASDVYLAFFSPSTNQAWKGTVKRFRIGVGSTDCGPNKELCLIGKTVLSSGFKDIEKSEVDPVSSLEQVVVDEQAVSFWNPVTLMDGSEPAAGGTGHQLISVGAYTPQSRNVYKYITGNALSPSTAVTLSDSTNLLTETNTRITKAMLGNAGMSDAAKSTLINFARGGNPGDAACSDAHDPSTPTACTTWRSWAHADVQHSRPLIVTYDSTPVPDAEVGGTTNRSNKQYLFFLTNDGLVHAVDAATGQEKWAFLVEEALPFIGTQMSNGSGPSLDLADGSPAVWIDRGDSDGIVDGSERVWLFFGLRRGGRAYYALDITDADAPKFMWKISSNYHPVNHAYYQPLGTSAGEGKLCSGTSPCADKTEYRLLGQTWSTPVVGRVATSAGRPAGNTDPVVIFGGGYDTQQDFASIASPTAPPAPLPPATLPATSTTGDYIGRSLYVVEASTGQPIKVFANTGGDFLNASGIAWSIPSDLAVINADLDAQGLLDRVMVGDMGGNLWRFDIGHTDVSSWKAKLLATLSDTGVPNRKIMFPPTIVPQHAPFPIDWDAIYVGTGDREHPLVTTTSDKIFMVADFDIGLTATTGAAASFAAGDFLALTATDTSGVVPSALLSKRGWYRDLEAGEKVTGSPFVFNQRLRFGSYNPSGIISECLPPGEGRLNEINALYGNLIDLSGDGTVSARDRFYAGISRGYFSPLQSVIIGNRIYTIALAGGTITTTGATGGPGGGPSASACQAGSQFWYCREQEIGIAQRIYWYMEPEL